MNSSILLWPLGVYFLVMLLLLAGMLTVSGLLGERHRSIHRDQPYESGMIPFGSARLRFSAQFYLVALFFVIFDLETVYLFSWAVAVREVGWSGYIEALIFIFVLLAALVYLWRVGALDWAPRQRNYRSSGKQ